MKCPKCKSSEDLAAHTVDSVVVDRCRACGGIWFDRQELSELLAEDARRVADLRRGGDDDAADDTRGRCPRDNSELLRIYSALDRSVVLDACADCHGIWLDRGEFDKLFAARQK